MSAVNSPLQAGPPDMATTHSRPFANNADTVQQPRQIPTKQCYSQRSRARASIPQRKTIPLADTKTPAEASTVRTEERRAPRNKTDLMPQRLRQNTCRQASHNG